MFYYDELAIKGFNAVAIEIMNDEGAVYDVAPSGAIGYRDTMGRFYFLVPKKSLAIIIDECGNVAYFDGYRVFTEM